MHAQVRRRTNPNCRDRNGCTPLVLSAAHGHTHVARALLELRADANVVAHGGVSPLLAAAIGRHPATVQLLCAHHHQQQPAGSSPSLDYQQALVGSGATALHIGVQHADDAVCAAVLAGAPVGLELVRLCGRQMRPHAC